MTSGHNLLPVPLSALEHYAYCPRQAGLILLEESYADDINTVRGTLLHQRVHEPSEETRPGVRTLRALPVWHDQLGLNGVCDVVELYDDGRVIPVEHKSGRYTPDGPADVQLAGQAICLEERFATSVPLGYIYSGADRRRHPVPIDADLRARVVELSTAVRTILTNSALPSPTADQRCRGCSMNTLCMPRLLADHRRYRNHLDQRFCPAAESDWDD
ncbi:CRISPR-associated protein Cas4 [Actinomadura kijaniata]|uniref:CRISPR-associated exonuclease Cas4 n=1 Tax=Actinomadura namibiensis TaxID=182080 RepID=A0A7W3LYE9_ACTNM|nr:CRISPR-associated protein Cas4 [Actinomadura namibiensis]MBA8956571.1 CRISPR-associated exonuclease Cas4 [Actinomadura namibiensis]